jgi:type I restriction enzyme M protein
LKPTYFKYEGESIFVIPDTLALKVDETKVNMDFLINELYSDYITKVVNSYRIGVAVPFIRKEDLLNTKIQLPSIEEQKAKVQGIREALAKEKEKELELFRKINGLESEITEQNTHLRHSLAGPASNLKGSFINIKKILSEKVLKNTPEIMELKVSEDHELTFGQYLEIIERDIDKITNAVSRRLKVETGIESKQLEKIEILSFIRNYVNEYREKGDLIFEFKFEIDEDAFLDFSGELIETYILANRDLLTDLLNNLTDNAVAHAFHPSWENKIEIYLMRDNEVGKVNEVQILFSNTGKSFPENIKFSDFIKKGSKAGLNSGEGYGGYYINEIIKYFKGDFDIIDEKGPEGLTSVDLATSFEINFPIMENGDYEKV